MGKRECFELFYKENYQRFFYFALRYMSNEEVCRDVVSMAFEYAWCELKVENMNEWKKVLLAYIHNKCIDVLRHEKVKSQFMQARIELAEHENAQQLLERSERAEMVERYLEELPPKTRLVLRECMVNGRKYKEVAEELELTEHAIKKHIVKGLKILREKVKNTK